MMGAPPGSACFQQARFGFQPKCRLPKARTTCGCSGDGLDPGGYAFFAVLWM